MIKNLLLLALLFFVFTSYSQVKKTPICDEINKITGCAYDSFNEIRKEKLMVLMGATTANIDFTFENCGAYIAEWSAANTNLKMKSIIDEVCKCGTVYSFLIPGTNKFYLGFYSPEYYDNPFGKIFIEGSKVKLAIYMHRRVRYRLVAKQTYIPNEKIKDALIKLLDAKGNLDKIKDGELKQDNSASGKKIEAGYWESNVKIPGTVLGRVETAINEKTHNKEEKYWAIIGTQLPYEKADSLFHVWDDVIKNSFYNKDVYYVHVTNGTVHAVNYCYRYVQGGKQKTHVVKLKFDTTGKVANLLINAGDMDPNEF